MSEFDDFEIDVAESNPFPVQGEWQKISIRPNVASGEKYNVGVLFKTDDATHIKLIGKSNRLKCLFDEEEIRSTMFALKHIEEMVISGIERPDIFELSPPLWACGDTVEEVLNSLFGQAVPLGKPVKNSKDKAEEVETISREALIGNVYRTLNSISLNSEKIIPIDRKVKINSDWPAIDIPLRYGERFADIVSATNRSSSTIKNKLNESVINLNAVRDHYNKLQVPALFILRPSKLLGFSPSEIQSANDIIEQLAWKTQRTIPIFHGEDASALADHAARWFEVSYG